jgi:hypothetical protein
MKMKWLASRLFVACSLLTAVPFTALTTEQEYSKDKKPPFKAASLPGCKKQSWTPEVFSFYGDPTAVAAKLNNFDMNLPNRRVFMFMIETANDAQISLFELAKESKDDKNMFHLWTWKGKSANDLREKATETILANRGVLCVGEQIKSLVKGLNPDDKGDIPAPKTALAAFGHTIHDYGSDYIRLTVFLLC